MLVLPRRNRSNCKFSTQAFNENPCYISYIPTSDECKPACQSICVTDRYPMCIQCNCQQGVLGGGVGGTSPECLSRAAMCVKLVSARTPEAVEGYQPEVRI